MQKKQPQIIGLAGTNGSGKDTVGQLLAAYHNYLFISVTDLLRAELKKRGLPIIRENLRMVSAEWRLESGLGVLMDMAMSSYKATANNYDGVVISSLRNSGEVVRIHELGGLVLWVDAEPSIRYQRIQSNASLRGRAEEDNKTYEQFLSEEHSEMNRPAGDDETTLNMLDVKEQSDAYINNSNNDMTALQGEVEKALGL